LAASSLHEATPKDSLPYTIMASPQLFSQIFATDSAFSSFFLLQIFLCLPALPCPWRFQFKAHSSMPEESFFSVCPTHFHFRRLIGIATNCFVCVHSSSFSYNVRLKVKVQCTLVQALRLCTGRTAHRGSRGIALLFHDQRY